jgi:hypothetical protein
VAFASGDWSAQIRPGDELYRLHAFPLTLSTPYRQVVDDSVAGYYRGDWVADFDAPGFTDETDHYTASCSASVSYTFTGTSIAWVGSENYNHGTAAVTIDGGARTTENLRADLAQGGRAVPAQRPERRVAHHQDRARLHPRHARHLPGRGRVHRGQLIPYGADSSKCSNETGYSALGRRAEIG